MVAGIDNWLFRWADNKECEPEINADGSITCKCCSNVDCEYWSEFNDYTLQKCIDGKLEAKWRAKNEN